MELLMASPRFGGFLGSEYKTFGHALTRHPSRKSFWCETPATRYAPFASVKVAILQQRASHEQQWSTANSHYGAWSILRDQSVRLTTVRSDSEQTDFRWFA